ncbi:hypothetical protein V0288_12900 [Pannus brasiliensis CCIBt3594]|uniref:Isopropylmalate/homocitrate/citramalate synthases n=1 Tax=Pannus brasiliensis CCIBt3594 TaxID=1427578 RepID=A0AAW9QSJ7_9CHRO
MEKIDRSARENFLYPRAGYYGMFTPENLVFNANLQEFSQKVALISSLHTGGKLSTPEAYERIHDLWRGLKHSKKALLPRKNEGTQEGI